MIQETPKKCAIASQAVRSTQQMQIQNETITVSMCVWA